VRSPFGAPPGQQPTDQFYDESPTVVLFVALIRSWLGAMISRWARSLASP